MCIRDRIISAVLQLLIFLSIPFVWYLLTQKRATGFFKWLGLKTAPTPPLKIMQFAFDRREPGNYLPYTYPANSVVYTGTRCV